MTHTIAKKVFDVVYAVVLWVVGLVLLLRGSYVISGLLLLSAVAFTVLAFTNYGIAITMQLSQQEMFFWFAVALVIIDFILLETGMITIDYFLTILIIAVSILFGRYPFQGQGG